MLNTDLTGNDSPCRVTVILTCHNRKQMTLNCIKAIASESGDFDVAFVVVDDGSDDGTSEAINELPYDITLLHGDGDLFWNGGMRKGIGHILEGTGQKTDDNSYILLVNDDVIFERGFLNSMISRERDAHPVVVVGATLSDTGAISYGGIKKQSDFFAKFSHIEPSEEVRQCDTFNANCVLIPWEIINAVGNVDSHYRHSLGDYDYGMAVRRAGYSIINSSAPVGRCNDNAVSGSWRDVTLSRGERLRLKESPKGLPAGEWFYFIRKNYGLASAVYHSVTPYLRILLKK